MEKKLIKTTYLVETPFPGHVQTMVYYFNDESHYVAYSQGQTLDEYMAERAENPMAKDLTEVSSEAADKLFEDYENSLITQPVEVTEERWEDMLNVLPPCRWGNYGGYNAFHVSEHLTGSLVNWFVRTGDKFYEFTDSCYLTTSQMIEKMEGV